MFNSVSYNDQHLFSALGREVPHICLNIQDLFSGPRKMASWTKALAVNEKQEDLSHFPSTHVKAGMSCVHITPVCTGRWKWAEPGSSLVSPAEVVRFSFSERLR